MSIKRKYVDSHWLIFAFEGAVALLFGWFALFTNLKEVSALVSIVGSTLLGLGIIELFNLLRRAHLNETWGFTLISALIEVGIAFALLFTADQELVWHLALIAGYTVVRGVFEILIGLKSVDDITDKFIWVITGICGTIMGFVILNSGNEAVSENALTFIKFFGAYMMLYGLANLIYGVHNHNQAEDLKAERSAIMKKSAAAKKLARVAKAPAKKTTAKKSVVKKTTTRKSAKKTTRRK
ncbi:DUF308 domain-containing protein [Candidatus Saccharibacteria bacterium]|nr:DUF308 domain-containing protein [Candidatus Saccharibacteria bacterium]